MHFIKFNNINFNIKMLDRSSKVCLIWIPERMLMEFNGLIPSLILSCISLVKYQCSWGRGGGYKKLEQSREYRQFHSGLLSR